jgi:hypothetical protein
MRVARPTPGTQGRCERSARAEALDVLAAALLALLLKNTPEGRCGPASAKVRAQSANGAPNV